MINIYKNFLVEVEMLSHSNHINVAKRVDSLRNVNGDLVIIMDHYDEGNLSHKRFTDVGNGYYPENEVIQIFRQVCSGMSYIHGKGGAHRDITPNNIMSKKGVIKIVDFGMACHLNVETQFSKEAVINFNYNPPEIVQLDNNYNAQKTDVY